MKLILIIALCFLLHPQLFAQSNSEEPIPFSELKETEEEIRNGNINIYNYKGALFTGIAIEKKLTHYFLYYFKNGKKHGNSTHYSKSDKAKMEWEYQNGILRASLAWYMDGEIKSEVQFSRKSEAQKGVNYYRNGQIKEK